MKWINVKDNLSTKSDCGKKFLCVIKECIYFQRYEVVEWFDPLTRGEEPLEEHEMPHFNIEVLSAGQQILNREVTHWMELPKLPLIN